MTSEKRSFEVNYLLSLSRIPDRFYGMIFAEDIQSQIKLAHEAAPLDTTPKASWYNPGTSLKSFIVAKCLRNETVELDGDMLTSARECERFSSNFNVLQRINESLIGSAAALTNQINTHSQAIRTLFLEDITQLHTIGQLVKLSFNALMSIQEPSGDQLNLLSGPGQTYKQAMFDFQDAIEHIIDKLHANTGKNPTAPQYA